MPVIEFLPVVDITTCTLRNGEWYAFDFGGRKFFATVYLNPLTGFLELTEIPDPYICKICGEAYQEGDHFGGHEYMARGEKRTWKGDV